MAVKNSSFLRWALSPFFLFLSGFFLILNHIPHVIRTRHFRFRWFLLLEGPYGSHVTIMGSDEIIFSLF